MSFRIVRFTIVAAVAAILPIASAAAQRAVTVSGHVTSRGLPLAGAHVRVDALGIDRTTDADGRYSFVVPATSVQGQTVTIVASMSDRRIRYAPVAVAVVLSGVPLVQDFDLVLAAGSEAFVAQDSAKHQAVELARPTTAAAPGAIEVDDAGGFGSLASVLVGRVAGLQVTPPSTPGGSSRLVFRGSRSALGADIGDLPSAASGQVARVVRQRWQVLSESGALALGEADETPVTRRLDVPALVALVALVTVGVALQLAL